MEAYLIQLQHLKGIFDWIVEFMYGCNQFYF